MSAELRLAALTVLSRQSLVSSGQSTVVSRQLLVDSWQWTVVSQQSIVDSSEKLIG